MDVTDAEQNNKYYLHSGIVILTCLQAAVRSFWTRCK